MEISLLEALLNNISCFNHLALCDNIKVEPVQKYYRKIDVILKHFKPVLDALVHSQIASNEQLNKVFEELDMLINEGRELVESWHPTTSKFYFVIQAESLISRIQSSCLDALKLLNSMHQDLPDPLNPTSVEQFIQKLRSLAYELSSSVVKEAIQAEVEKSTPNSEYMVKIADALNLTTNHDLLMEAVALEKVKLQAEQDENDKEVEYIDHMICLVTLMHELLIKVKQSQNTSAVSIPGDFCCPLSLGLMRDPVIVASGQTYERTYIRKWLDLGLNVCPKTRHTLAHTNLIPNYTVKALIANWCETNNVEIPDPDKFWKLNQTSTLLSHAGSYPRDSHAASRPRDSHVGSRPRNSHVHGQSTRVFTKTNLVNSTETTRSIGSLNKNVLSSDGTNLERKSLSVGSSDLEGSLDGEVGNDFGLDACRISLGSSEERDTKAEERNMDTGNADPSKENNAETSGADVQFQGHSRTASVSSIVSNTDSFQGNSGDGNDVSRISGDLTNYSNNVSGELTLDSPSPASLRPQRESEFSTRMMETRSRSHTIWRRPSERLVPRVVSSSAIDTRADLLGIETQVKKLVEDLQSMSVDLLRATTSELRLLAKHNMDNRIVIAKCGAISLLVGLLHSTDTKIQENAVTALLNLSINDNNKSAIANADAIDPLIHVLETGSPEAKENSAATLFSLSVIEENKVRIGRSRAIGPLVDLLGNGTPRGKKDAATALFNLSIFHENKARIVQAGAVRYLVELMDPAAGMVDKAVAVLANLATITEGRSAIGQAGGIPVLVEVVELGSARGKENAAAALLQLCTNSSRFCSMVLQEGAVPPLVALSQSGTPRAKEKAQALLSYFRTQRHGNAGRG